MDKNRKGILKSPFVYFLPVNPCGNPRQGMSDAYSDTYTHNPPLVAISEVGKGRIVVVSLGGWKPYSVGSGGYGSTTLTDHQIEKLDNQIFALNVINWLSHET